MLRLAVVHLAPGALCSLPDDPSHRRTNLPWLPQYSYTSKQRRRYEQLLRRLLLLRSQPAVVLLQAYTWWCSFGDGILQGLYYREPEIEMTVLGQVTRE